MDDSTSREIHPFRTTGDAMWQWNHSLGNVSQGRLFIFSFFSNHSPDLLCPCDCQDHEWKTPTLPELPWEHAASVQAFCNSWLQLAWTSVACVATLRAASVDKELTGELSGHTVLWSGGKQTDKPVCTQMLLRSVANQSTDNNAESGFCFVAKLDNLFPTTRRQSESNMLSLTQGKSCYRCVPEFSEFLL